MRPARITRCATRRSGGTATWTWRFTSATACPASRPPSSFSVHGPAGFAGRSARESSAKGSPTAPWWQTCCAARARLAGSTLTAPASSSSTWRSGIGWTGLRAARGQRRSVRATTWGRTWPPSRRTCRTCWSTTSSGSGPLTSFTTRTPGSDSGGTGLRSAARRPALGRGSRRRTRPSRSTWTATSTGAGAGSARRALSVRRMWRCPTPWSTAASGSGPSPPQSAVRGSAASRPTSATSPLAAARTTA
mmetsp:Transcript_88229/g.244873  ORF Transcript_88229/g.244873 Transcript_88229/m.244873 type:complete len:248 (-) Transcript_88229:66-809(-)